MYLSFVFFTLNLIYINAHYFHQYVVFSFIGNIKLQCSFSTILYLLALPKFHKLKFSVVHAMTVEVKQAAKSVNICSSLFLLKLHTWLYNNRQCMHHSYSFYCIAMNVGKNKLSLYTDISFCFFYASH